MCKANIDNPLYSDVIFRDIRLVGSLLGKQQYLQETVDLCAKHGIEVGPDDVLKWIGVS